MHLGKRRRGVLVLSRFQKFDALVHRFAVIRFFGRIDHLEKALGRTGEHTRDLHFAFGGHVVVFGEHFIVIIGGLRFVSHIVITGGKSFVCVRERLYLADGKIAEPAVDRHFVRFHVVVNFRQKHPVIGLRTVKVDLFMDHAQRRAKILFVAVTLGEFDKTIFARIERDYFFIHSGTSYVRAPARSFSTSSAEKT